MDVTDPSFRVAAASRILARNGCESRVGGHVTVRAEEGDAFWMSPWEYFDEATPDGVVKLSFALEPLEGIASFSGAAQFDAGIYKSRPDVNAVIHVHSYWISLFSTVPRFVGQYNVISCLFYDEQTFYDDDGTHPPVDPDLMADSLGNKRVLLMKNHGSVVVASSLESCTIETVLLEAAAQYHLEAERIGGSEIPVSETLRRRDDYRRVVVPEMWKANFRRLKRSDPDLMALLDDPIGASVG
jgi:L-fuculose-phosphate aldolase